MGTALIAVVRVFLCSRVNPPQPSPDNASARLASGEVLADVWVDDRSLPLAIASIQKVARSRIVLDERAVERAGVDMAGPIDTPRFAPQRFRNIRLGTLLALLLKSFDAYQLECIVERDTITLGAPTRTPSDRVLRLYDIRDIRDPYLEWADQCKPVEQQGGTRGPSRNPDSEAVEALDRIAESNMPTHVTGEQFHSNAIARRGWIMFEATPAGHRQFERFLALLRRPDSHEFRLKGALQ